jgi:hypothetical protein
MARKSQLVSQHLENISRKALEEHQDIVRTYVRDRQGIYALFRRGKLYYVGLASNLNFRLNQHLRDRHKGSWDRFSVYLTIGDRHLRELETLLLRIVRPVGNKVGAKFVKSENLRARFRRDIRVWLKNEFTTIFGEKAIPGRGEKEQSVLKRKGRRSLPLAPFVDRRLALTAVYKGKTLKAWVRKDGYIYFNGSYYKSPSATAKAAIDSGAANGWVFWKYQRAPGDWVPLREIKKGNVVELRRYERCVTKSARHARRGSVG